MSSEHVLLRHICRVIPQQFVPPIQQDKVNVTGYYKDVGDDDHKETSFLNESRGADFRRPIAPGTSAKTFPSSFILWFRYIQARYKRLLFIPRSDALLDATVQDEDNAHSKDAIEEEEIDALGRG